MSKSNALSILKSGINLPDGDDIIHQRPAGISWKGTRRRPQHWMALNWHGTPRLHTTTTAAATTQCALAEMRGYHIHMTLRPKSQQEDFVPASIFQHLPDHSTTPKKSLTRLEASTTTQNTSTEDYRLGPISVDWMDFEEGQSFSGKDTLRGRGPAECAFVPLQRHHKSGSTDLPEGVIHIFRDMANKQPLEQLELQTQALSLDTNANAAEDGGVILAVLAVPPWMTPSDFLAFVAPVADGIAHLRIVHDFAPNRSIALIKFSSPANASEFATEYNGKPFNSMEPEICHVVHVLSVVVDIEDPVTQALSHGSMYELPTCPVCLERMDSAVTGLITVPCSHTFHCHCLSKWGDSRCPVCRYSQTLLSSHPAPSSSTRPAGLFSPTTNSQSSPTFSRCSACASTTNLWICLICGNVGCGRYGQAHAHAHYQATTHLYALELETQRVWDYAGDGYVHRLIQNKADGKLVELPSAASSMGIPPHSSANSSGRDGHGLGPTQADALSAEKIEAIGIEYSYLLTSQLDSQRAFYEEQTGELREQLADLKSLVGRLTLDFEEERRQRASNLDLEARKLAELKEQLAAAAKDKAKAEARAERALELARRFEKELKEEKAVSEGLMHNLGKLKERVEEFEKEKEAYAERVRELEDQVRDVMFFVEAKTKIESGEGLEGEALGGSLEVSVPPTPTAGGKKKGKRKGG